MLQSANVAIVDDDASMRAALTRLLRLHGIKSQVHPSARAFLMALPSARPDCLIVDVNMPDMTGLDLQRELLKTGVYIPTIVITGNADASTASNAISLGAAAFFLKPVQRDALITAINSATTRQHTHTRDNCDHSGVVVDWLDACRSRKLDALLNLYEERATLNCDCDGVNLAGRISLAVYWKSKVERMADSAFTLGGMIVTGDEIHVQCRSCKGKPVRIRFRFSSVGKILHTGFSPLSFAA